MDVHVSSETYIRLERLFFLWTPPGGGHIGSPHMFEINTKIAKKKMNSKIVSRSLREILGLSKGAYGSLNKFQRAALQDYEKWVST